MYLRIMISKRQKMCKEIHHGYFLLLLCHKHKDFDIKDVCFFHSIMEIYILR